MCGFELPFFLFSCSPVNDAGHTGVTQLFAYRIDRLRDGGGATRWACEGLTETGLDLASGSAAALASVGVSVALPLASLAWAWEEAVGSVSAWGGDSARPSARSTLTYVSLSTLCGPGIGRVGIRNSNSSLPVVAIYR